jgi:DNA (cytosine-5)-methyltransferase 1
VSERCDSWKKIATFNTKTNSNGLNQCNSDNEVNTSEGRVNALSNIDKSNGDGNVADTNGIGGRQNEWFANGKSNVNDKNSAPGTWENFPTQSPICNGDDGIPTGLDGITFSKWRNESIKAGGNAIVPQVVLQIFKTIEQYERINTPDKNS